MPILQPQWIFIREFWSGTKEKQSAASPDHFGRRLNDVVLPNLNEPKSDLRRLSAEDSQFPRMHFLGSSRFPVWPQNVNVIKSRRSISS